MNATMDPVSCAGFVDFNVPGKLNPSPIKLAATVWTQSLYLPTGALEKYAIEFTDPSGILASPSAPLNTWVQLENIVTKEHSVTTPTSCIERSPLVFKDQHNNDQKLVSLSKNDLTIVPFDTDDKTLFVSTVLF